MKPVDRMIYQTTCLNITPSTLCFPRNKIYLNISFHLQVIFRESREAERRWLRQSNAKLLSWVFAPLAKAPWRSSLYRCHRHTPPPSYQHWNSYTLISPVHFKTSILIHIFQGQFVDSYDPTIEETFNKNIKIRNQVNWKHSTYL